MELPFELYNLLVKLDEKPGLLVAFAAFHPIALGILFWILHLLNKYIFTIKLKDDSDFVQLAAVVFAIGWFGNFFIGILLMFSGVSGIKMLLIFLSLYLCATAFVISVPKTLLEQFRKDENGESMIDKVRRKQGK